ncbi:MAG: DUF2089 domain-containing protein [Anaeroplasmataceae bacterium]|nr:DUF2089 domain-containing protein [Anaeroplasmataceae bacterium]
MKKKLLGLCPVCDQRLSVTELSCKECGTTLKGEFKLSKFDYLSSELQEFALIFIKNAGNIKGVEKELNISYPTVKKNLDELIRSLGFSSLNIAIEEKMSREEILAALKRKEITFEVAEKMLKEL